MGQRLVINVFKTQDEDSRVANVYFHWSGYTQSSYDEVFRMMQALSDVRNKSDDYIQKTLILLYQNRNDGYIDVLHKEKRHGGLMEATEEDTMKELKRLGLSQDPHLDRSIGFVAVTPSGMDENMSYAEAVASIYLDTFTVDLMGVWCRIPLSGLEHIDGKWIYGDSKNPEVEIPDVEWNSLKKIRTDDLSMEDVKSFLNSQTNIYYIDPEWDDLLVEIA